MKCLHIFNVMPWQQWLEDIAETIVKFKECNVNSWRQEAVQQSSGSASTVFLMAAIQDVPGEEVKSLWQSLALFLRLIPERKRLGKLKDPFTILCRALFLILSIHYGIVHF